MCPFDTQKNSVIAWGVNEGIVTTALNPAPLYRRCDCPKKAFGREKANCQGEASLEIFLKESRGMSGKDRLLQGYGKHRKLPLPMSLVLGYIDSCCRVPMGLFSYFASAL